MKNYSIAVIPGDGIGNEVMPEGIKVLKAAAEVAGGFRFEFTSFPWGSEYYLEHGCMMPENGLSSLASFDSIYFGAVGHPQIPDWITLRGLRLAICQGFDQYANLRPSILLPGIKGPLRDKTPGDIDFIIVRENTEGEYSGAGGRAHRGLQLEVAVQTSIFTREGVERVIRYAYELAKSRRKRLVNVTKPNAMEFTFGLWDEIFDHVGADYPDVTTERMLVDAMTAKMVLRPETLDVIVASNLFADILTDLGAALAGSLGMAPTANINPERRFPSMFEPIHGSAPDIFGKGIANPIGMVWTGAMMLDFLGETQAADLILSAIKSVTGRGYPLTPDIGGRATTVEVGDAIVEQLRLPAH
jgi:tartrate dehydrogenase/decarboxylase/D-malate dehydrogenase